VTFHPYEVQHVIGYHHEQGQCVDIVAYSPHLVKDNGCASMTRSVRRKDKMTLQYERLCVSKEACVIEDKEFISSSHILAFMECMISHFLF
jgi:hypothetical protein